MIGRRGRPSSLLEIESYQKRQGYGSKLYNYIENIAREAGVSMIRVEGIDKFKEDAIGFFKAMGFTLKDDECDLIHLWMARRDFNCMDG